MSNQSDGSCVLRRELARRSFERPSSRLRSESHISSAIADAGLAAQGRRGSEVRGWRWCERVDGDVADGAGGRKFDEKKLECALVHDSTCTLLYP